MFVSESHCFKCSGFFSYLGRTQSLLIFFLPLPFPLGAITISFHQDYGLPPPSPSLPFLVRIHSRLTSTSPPPLPPHKRILANEYMYGLSLRRSRFTVYISRAAPSCIFTAPPVHTFPPICARFGLIARVAKQPTEFRPCVFSGPNQKPRSRHHDAYDYDIR